MKEMTYHRQKACEYAKKWAYARNPKYYNFDAVGGDCTSFISQCIYEGVPIMNYAKEKGWYYIDGNRKSPSWSGVSYLYQFLTQNKKEGPYGKEVSEHEIEIGDIAQLSFDGKNFAHTTLIVRIENKLDFNDIYVASHTYDAFEKRIASYAFKKIRWIHIQGGRKFVTIHS